MEKAREQLEIVLRYFSDFSPVQLQQLAALEPLYTEWNAKINVISRKDIGSLYEKHVLHSLAIAAVFEFTPDTAVIDIGAGGGFPGIPLAILFPNTRFHLVDSIGKKIRVVEAVAAALGLTNVSAEHSRAEEIKGRKFDTAVSRAVAPLKDLWTWAQPLLRRSDSRSTGPTAKTSATRATPKGSNPGPGGLICLKGGDLAGEISASRLHPKLIEIKDIFPLDYFHEKYILQVPY